MRAPPSNSVDLIVAVRDNTERILITNANVVKAAALHAADPNTYPKVYALPANFMQPRSRGHRCQLDAQVWAKTCKVLAAENDCNLEKLAPMLFVYTGMRGTVTHNVSVDWGIANGTPFEVVGFNWKSSADDPQQISTVAIKTSFDPISTTLINVYTPDSEHLPSHLLIKVCV